MTIEMIEMIETIDTIDMINYSRLDNSRLTSAAKRNETSVANDLPINN